MTAISLKAGGKGRQLHTRPAQIVTARHCRFTSIAIRPALRLCPSLYRQEVPRQEQEKEKLCKDSKLPLGVFKDKAMDLLLALQYGIPFTFVSCTLT